MSVFVISYKKTRLSYVYADGEENMSKNIKKNRQKRDDSVILIEFFLSICYYIIYSYIARGIL